MANKKTTYHAWIFLAGAALIIAAAILFGISEYTEEPLKGMRQEKWSIALFCTGLLAFIVGPRLGGSGD